MQINEIMLVIVRAAAHPVQTQDAIRNGDFWHGILSSQENRDSTHKDGHDQKNLLEIISDGPRTYWNFMYHLLPSWNKTPHAALQQEC